MNAPAEILASIGGADNVENLTHCATRLRFQLHDNSGIDEKQVESIPGVMGAVSQSGNRYQVVIGGAVESVYNDIMALPEMKEGGSATGTQKSGSNADVKSAAKEKGPRGRFTWLDSFFDFLGDSFRPILGSLLGASLIITFMALMGTLGVIGNWADPRTELSPTWQFINLCWRCVFYFLPLMVAYNASKKLGADPWIGFAVMAVVMLPGFTSLGQYATHLTFAGSEINVVRLFGGHLPLTIFDYGSQVFPPLLMAAVLGPLYKLLKKIISPNVQLIFVPFLSMLIMIPLTAFLIGPLGVYAGAGLANGLKAVNDFSPFIFAILIPMLYPFMVPLGLHWPLNAIMLLNIQTLGFDFIQGPMGAWNFACFGATAGVLFLSVRDRDVTMRQTATGALAAGLLGGISEPSLYGIHLRFKRIYPRILVGCFLGGLVQGIGGGLTTNAFVFTSLLTIPAFSNIPLYAISIAVAFFSSMLLVVFFDYRTADERAEAAKVRATEDADQAAEEARKASAEAHKAELRADDAEARADQAEQRAATTTVAAERAAQVATAVAPARTALAPNAVTQIASPVAGYVVPLDKVPDPVFAKGTVGLGVGIDPTGDTITSPGDGKIIVAQDTGHAFGIKLDNGIELLIHVGIDTVNLGGTGFDVHVARGDRVTTGDVLVRFDRKVIESAGYSMITPVLVTNPRKFASVTQAPATLSSALVAPGDTIITVTAKPPKDGAAAAPGTPPAPAHRSAAQAVAAGDSKAGASASTEAPGSSVGGASVGGAAAGGSPAPGSTVPGVSAHGVSAHGDAQASPQGTGTADGARRAATTAGAADSSGSAAASGAAPGSALVAGAVTEIGSPVAGRVVALSDVPDPVFSKGIVGLGVGIDPTGDTITSPGDGKIIVAQDTGHAFGIKLDNGIELLIHVGIDTVNLGGTGFDVHVARGDRVTTGDVLVRFDRKVIESAGYSMITPVLVTNPRKFASVTQAAQGAVTPGEGIITVTAKQ
ncbi:glucose PTS transporter subunit IIA [Propionibacterium freudenreichii]|uniref:glucose PTS transporter subunit IIA n=2 Tax=Propionibacterium freudenreichii TaxID=1744 RepID=UPI002F913C9D